MSYSLSRQGGEEGAQEGAHEGVLQESHVLVRAGGVKLQTGKCREQIGEEIYLEQIKEEIHLWNIIFCVIWSLHIHL